MAWLERRARCFRRQTAVLREVATTTATSAGSVVCLGFVSLAAPHMHLPTWRHACAVPALRAAALHVGPGRGARRRATRTETSTEHALIHARRRGASGERVRRCDWLIPATHMASSGTQMRVCSDALHAPYTLRCQAARRAHACLSVSVDSSARARHRRQATSGCLDGAAVTATATGERAATRRQRACRYCRARSRRVRSQTHADRPRAAARSQLCVARAFTAHALAYASCKSLTGKSLIVEAPLGESPTGSTAFPRARFHGKRESQKNFDSHGAPANSARSATSIAPACRSVATFVVRRAPSLAQ